MVPFWIKPSHFQIAMICEALPENAADYFYTSTDSLYVTNMIAAVNNAGVKVRSIRDIVNQGVYLTVAVKEVRKGLVVPTKSIESHSFGLEEELKQFPNLKAILLMGDAAIKAINYISKRLYKKRAIAAGPTYKIRKDKYYLGEVRVFPSYLPTGKNFLIEKSKRAMVAEDIKNAFKLIK